MINSYRFGKISIDGKDYKSDVIIFPGKVLPDWKRKNGHTLDAGDLSEAYGGKPGVLVVGTGYFGMLKVPQSIVDDAATRGIEIIAQRTGKALKTLNSLFEEKKNAAGAFHLTC